MPPAYPTQVPIPPKTAKNLQTSSNLLSTNWQPVSTNWLAGNVLNITNTISSGIPRQFMRALWLP
jgi:hypothetical protein